MYPVNSNCKKTFVIVLTGALLLYYTTFQPSHLPTLIFCLLSCSLNTVPKTVLKFSVHGNILAKKFFLNLSAVYLHMYSHTTWQYLL